MATLSQILETKRNTFRNAEENIERGQITVFANPAQFSGYYNNFCWQAPGCGQVEIELWGASGSGAKMCCCGFGLPGNPGAYAKKTIQVVPGDWVCGYPGKACANSNDLCFRGCSDPSWVGWQGRDCKGATSGYICAQGGRGGISMCSTGWSAYCCYIQFMCGTQYAGASTYCGVICNRCIGGNGWEAQAYGGDINCCGGFSCASFLQCSPECMCYYHYHLAISPGIVSVDGAVAVYTQENNNEFSNWSGQGWHEALSAVNTLSRFPSQATPHATCWGFSGTCGCYDTDGCTRAMPTGVPGLPPHPCAGVRDHAHTGGNGAVRIKFLAG